MWRHDGEVERRRLTDLVVPGISGCGGANAQPVLTKSKRIESEKCLAVLRRKPRRGTVIETDGEAG